MKIKKSQPIFTGKIEKFSHEILFKNRYKEILHKRIEGRHGIYALYDKDKNLYYIGQTNQMKKRIQYHKKDHHAKKWETFSVLFTRKVNYPVFLEDALISIAGAPKGNKQKPLKIKSLNSQIEKDMKEIDDKKRHKITGTKLSKRNTKKKRRIKAVKTRGSRKNQEGNPFKKRVTLKADYYGKEYTAKWLQSGKVKFEKYRDKPYSSPHALAQVIVSRVNRRPMGTYGKRFWKVKKRNKWVKLCDL